MSVQPLKGMVFLGQTKQGTTSENKHAVKVVQADNSNSNTNNAKTEIDRSVKALEKAYDVLSAVENTVDAIEKREKFAASRQIKISLQGLRDIAHLAGLSDYDVAAISNVANRIG